MLFATLIGFVGGMSNYLPVYDVELFPYTPYGTYGVPIFVAIYTYAIVKLRRSHGALSGIRGISTVDKGLNCSTVKLEDGTTMVNLNFTEHAPLHMGFLQVGKNIIKHRLGYAAGCLRVFFGRN